MADEGKSSVSVVVRFELEPVWVGRVCRRVPHSLNALNRMPSVHQRARWMAAWKEWTYLLAVKHRNLLGRYEPFAQADVILTLYAVQEMDEDNARGSLKPVVDGLKGVLIVDDDRTHIRRTVHQERVAERALERVAVEVREAVF